MSNKYCGYQDCFNIRSTHGQITFFTIPNDERRKVWIQNSGNKALRLMHDKSVRFICEKHFESKYLRHQFSRTTLSKSAVPIKYSAKTKELKFENHLAQHDVLFNSPLPESCEIVLRSSKEDETKISNEDSNDYIEYNIEYIENNEKDVRVQNNETTEEEMNNLSYMNFKKSFEVTLLKDTNESDKSDITENQYILKDNAPLITVKNKHKSRFNKDKSCSSYEITSSTNEFSEKQTDSYQIKFTENNFEDNVLSSVPENLNIVKTTQNSKTAKEADIRINDQDYDQDVHFALSLVGNFQRLPLQKKALAKVKILQYLTNLEFREDKTLDI